MSKVNYEDLIEIAPNFETWFRMAKAAEKLSDSKIAEEIGIDRRNVSWWATGKFRPNMKNLKKLSDIFNVDPRLLIFKYYFEDPA